MKYLSKVTLFVLITILGVLSCAQPNSSATTLSASSLPDALVGTWDGDPSQGIADSWTFTADGEYQYASASIYGKSPNCSGRAQVSGSVLRLSPRTRGCPASAMRWRVDGNTLYLDDSRYFRKDIQENPAQCLVGAWDVSHVSYRVDGSAFGEDGPVTIESRRKPDGDIGWTWRFGSDGQLSETFNDYIEYIPGSSNGLEFVYTGEAQARYTLRGTTLNYTAPSGSVTVRVYRDGAFVNSRQIKPSYSPESMTCTKRRLTLRQGNREINLWRR